MGLKNYREQRGVIIGLDPIIQLLSKFSWIPVGMYPHENGDANDTKNVFFTKTKSKARFLLTNTLVKMTFIF